MEQHKTGGDRVERLRRWMLWVLLFGLVGTELELLLLEHYEDIWQLVPLFLIAAAIAVLPWHRQTRNTASRRALLTVMALIFFAGFAGIALHFQGAAEFQLEIDPAISAWDLVKKAMRAKAPPVLAPGVMLQLGLIGLAYVLTDSRDKRRELL